MRYATAPLENIWSDQGYINRMVEVENAVLKHRGHKPLFTTITAHEVRELEAKIGHEVEALVRIMDQRLGHNFTHAGLTSSDTTDTARALQMRDSYHAFRTIIDCISGALFDLIDNVGDTPCIGRTHGQYAVPMRFNHRLKNWHHQIATAGSLLNHNHHLICGKVSGAVGTNVWVSEDDERAITSDLDITHSGFATQIVPRVNWMGWWSALNTAAMAAGKVLNDLRVLSQSGINEYSPPAPTVSSSTMTHKSNPSRLESAIGALQMARHSYHALVESAAGNWLERDLTNSSVERVHLPRLHCYTHYGLVSLSDALIHGEFSADNMLLNLNRAIQEGCLNEHAYVTALLDGKSRSEARGESSDGGLERYLS